MVVGLEWRMCICSKLHVMVEDPVTSHAPWSIRTWSLNRRSVRQWYFRANKQSIKILNIYPYAVWKKWNSQSSSSYISKHKQSLIQCFHFFPPSHFTYVPRVFVFPVYLQPTTSQAIMPCNWHNTRWWFHAAVLHIDLGELLVGPRSRSLSAG